MIKVDLSKSNKSDKRFKVIITDDDKKKTVHFGLKNPKKGTYLEHNDDKIKEAWIARHKVRGKFNDIYTPSFWSMWLLWNKPTLEESINDIENRFNLEIV